MTENTTFCTQIAFDRTNKNSQKHIKPLRGNMGTLLPDAPQKRYKTPARNI